MFLLNIGVEIREWSMWALALGAIAISILVAGWNIRGQWVKDLEKLKEKFEAALKEATDKSERELQHQSDQMQRSLEHRAAADLARWEKLEERYESLFEKLCERRRKP